MTRYVCTCSASALRPISAVGWIESCKKEAVTATYSEKTWGGFDEPPAPDRPTTEGAIRGEPPRQTRLPGACQTPREDALAFLSHALGTSVRLRESWPAETGIGSPSERPAQGFVADPRIRAP